MSVSYCQPRPELVSPKFGAKLGDGVEEVAVDCEDYIARFYLDGVGGPLGLHAYNFNSVVSHSLNGCGRRALIYWKKMLPSAKRFGARLPILIELRVS